MKVIDKIFFIILFFISVSIAQEVNIDNLLKDIEIKTDLSQKTKLENGGISFIYTRDDLHRMQAKKLKDILKSSYPFGYDENRFGLPDPHNMTTTHPFMSSAIRIYIDDQEISTGLYGSGLIIYGDMDIDFVDHIEVYHGNPTYEYSTESTFTLIKLYSKVASKDAGSRVSISGGSYGASNINIYNSQELDNDWSYFTYISQNNDKRQKIQSYNTSLSKDKKDTHMFISFYDDNNKIMIDAIRQKRDSFMDQSIDATPINAEINRDYLHIGYNGNYDNFLYLLTYDLSNVKADFEDDVMPLPIFNYMYPVASSAVYSKSNVFTGELKYKYNTTSNKLVAGIKYRYKDFKYTTLTRNRIPLPLTGNTNQSIATAFIENQYFIKSNSILTTGISFSRVRNNNSIQDDDLLMYRVGHTYTNNNWIFKTIFAHNEKTLDPYLVNSYGFFITNGKKDPEEQILLIENITYKKENNKYELVLSATKAKNQLMPNSQSGLLENYDKDLNVLNSEFRWTYNYRDYDKLYMAIGYNHIHNLPMFSDSLHQYTSTIRALNTYEKFDFFNELLFTRDNIENNNFYDYSLGAIYHYTKDLSISIKGTNVLDKARTRSYMRVNPVTFEQETPLNISPIDRSFMATVEYLF